MSEFKQRSSLKTKAKHEEAETNDRGHLKIFLGYAPGTGKTSAMLESAHIAKAQGLDVVAGYVDAHSHQKAIALLDRLECLPAQDLLVNGIVMHEFNIDSALKRKPQLILIDDFAHTNARGCRHTKRYQDIKELLNAGINVYTTVNVQQIESLCDIVASITGDFVDERIPDYLFDTANQVELVDAEPQEIIEWFNNDNNQDKQDSLNIAENFFTIEVLTALREISLRRCADRVNFIAENARTKGHTDYHTDEHILVCLSSSRSNAKIIRTAARMATAFKGSFTALFVETPDFSSMSEENIQCLHSNMRLAEQLGAKIETVYGDDVPLQIAEFARISGVSKIVIGRSTATKRYPFSKMTLTEKLIANAPNLDVHIIPDNISNTSIYQFKKSKFKKYFAFSVIDIFKCITLLLIATLIGVVFRDLDFAEANIITVYVLGVLVTAVITEHQIYSLISSIVSVLIFNFMFTAPIFTLHVYGEGYPVTFLIMFSAAFLTGTLATQLKTQARLSASSAYRTKVLFDTNQMLQQAEDKFEIVSVTSNQLIKLLGKDIIFYLVDSNKLNEPLTFSSTNADFQEYLTAREESVANWVFKNNKRAGATTETLSNAKCLYLAVRINKVVYGVVGIVIDEKTLDPFEKSILLSIIGECALALENEKNLREKEESSLLARNEQLRANLLRSISHDLRTPLTSISGNASNLMSNSTYFDDATKKQVYTDIYDDSMWLINLVENLLAISRFEEGQLNISITDDLIDDVISEALSHVNRKSIEHHIEVKSSDYLLLAKMDARLIVQVIINIVDNAIKYTPQNSHIIISTEKNGDKAIISISDDGPGIPDELKPHIFDMFYSGANKIADSRRSLGLGLSLCKSIVNAHGGEINVSDNNPHGSIFSFTLPLGEVKSYE